MKLSLSRKPDAVAWSIEELLEKVRDGQIRLPEFQRLYKWTANDVVELFDSIVRGFPIGTFLFWKGFAASTPEGRPLEPLSSASPSRRSDLLFVLDGQQRLTSLTGVLLSLQEPTDERFRVAFALDRDELLRVPPGEPWPEQAVPLFHVLDSVNLMTWAAAKGLDAAGQRRALEVGRAIREYRVPAYIIVAEDEDTARLVYDRVNRAGKALTKADVFKALQEGVGSQEPNSLAGLEKSVEDIGFGSLRDNLLLQAAAAVAGLDVTKIDHRALARPELGDALPRTAAALRKALAFLRHDAHIPSVELLPFQFPIVALTRFFDLFPEPRPRSRDLLSRWVWRGAITQKHWAHEQAYLRETLKAINGVDEELEIQQMLKLLPRQPTLPQMTDYSLKSTQTRLHLLALLDLRPRDLASGEPLDGAALIASEGSSAVHLLVDAPPTGTADEDAARASIFGRVIQRPSSHQRLIGFLSSLHADADVLASLGLAVEDVHAIGKGLPFAQRRRERLSQHFSDFFERRARWEETDRPSLGSLVVEDSP